MLVRTSPFMPTMSRFFNEDWPTMKEWSKDHKTRTHLTTPSVNVQETDEAYLVHVAAPGMKKEDFSIEVEDHRLTIKAEGTASEDSADIKWTRREFNYSSFSRSFKLNDAMVDESAIAATYQDGILHVTLPKKAEAKADLVKRIEIQ